MRSARGHERRREQPKRATATGVAEALFSACGASLQRPSDTLRRTALPRLAPHGHIDFRVSCRTCRESSRRRGYVLVGLVDVRSCASLVQDLHGASSGDRGSCGRLATYKRTMAPRRSPERHREGPIGPGLPGGRFCSSLTSCPSRKARSQFQAAERAMGRAWRRLARAHRRVRLRWGAFPIARCVAPVRGRSESHG